MALDAQGNICQFSKTKMCKFHVVKRCTKGAQCPFAHDPLELRNQPDLRCTKLCKTFSQTGECNNKACTYAHGKEELRSTGAFHKTKLCRYRQTGHCSLGGKCNFAHSQCELREPDTSETLQSPSEVESNDMFEAKAPPGLGWDSYFDFLEDDAGEEESFVSSAGSSDTVDERASKVLQGILMDSGTSLQGKVVDSGSFGNFQHELGVEDLMSFHMASSANHTYEDYGNTAYNAACGDWADGLGEPMVYDMSVYSYGDVDVGSWDWRMFADNAVADQSEAWKYQCI